jgi:replicative DNA helicase
MSSSAHIEAHARHIIEHKIKRDLILFANDIHHEAYEDTSDSIELLEKSHKAIDQIGGKYLKGNFRSAKELTKEFYQKLIERRGQKGMTGVPSGLDRLDRVTGGFQNTDLILIAARPMVGKTAILLSFALNQSIRHQIPVGIFSLEMGAQQLIGRAHASEAQINTERIFKNYIDDNDLIQIGNMSDNVGTTNLWIDDTPSITITEFRGRARRLVHEKKVKIIYVDYLQLLSVSTSKHSTREQEISAISKGLKQVAKELNIPIVALSQLSRAVETRGGEKRPQLSDLREGGSQEADADLIFLLYRPELYGITETSDGISTNGLMEVIIAKHRNGGLENVPLKFIGKYTKVMDWDSAPEVPPNFVPLNSRLPYADEKSDQPF